MRLSKLEIYLEILRAISEDCATKQTHTKNPFLEEIVFRRADIDFLIRQRVITQRRYNGRSIYKITERGTAILRYFTQNQRDVYVQKWVENR